MRIVHINKRLLQIVMAISCAIFANQTAVAQFENFAISGFGDIHYNKAINETGSLKNQDVLDFHVAALNVGYKINKKVSIHSRLRFEHVFSGFDQGEDIYIDQGYIDYAVKAGTGFRAGLHSVPVGGGKFKYYNGTETSRFEKYLTYAWRELSIGVYGKITDAIGYDAYLITGLDINELSSATGVFNARNNPISSSANNVGIAARISYQFSGDLKFGLSGVYSDLYSDGKYGNELKGANFRLLEGHAVYNKKGFMGRMVGAVIQVSGSGQINKITNNNLGSTPYGALAEAGYDLLHSRNGDTIKHFILFARGESYNMYSGEPGYDGACHDYTTGLVLVLTSGVTLKADYQILQSGETDTKQQFNMGIRYRF